MVPATLDFQHKAAMNRFKDISGGTAREILAVCLFILNQRIWAPFGTASLFVEVLQ